MLEELEFFLYVCINSLPLGSVYCLLALGFVLIYKCTKILNLCQGEIMMLGSYVTYSVMQTEMPFFMAVIISLGVTSIVALFLERIIIRRFMGKPIFLSIMVTAGLGILLRGLIGLIWGVQQKVLEVPYFEKMAGLPFVRMNYGKVAIIITGLAMIVILQLFFKYSKLGTAIRATASNLAASMFMGVNVTRMFSLSWVLASMVSVFTGIFLSRLTTLEPGISKYAFVALSAFVLGGVDSIIGTIVGGFAIGIGEGLAIFYIGGQSRGLAGFAIMFLVLMIRPYGLFGTKKVDRV